MPFVDDLRKIEQQHTVDKTKEIFEKNIKEIYAVIKNECVKNVSKHLVSGYILHHYDDEYCVYDYQFKNTLFLDNSIAIDSPSKYRNKNDRFFSNIALYRRYKAGRDGYEPISVQKEQCDEYIYSLKNLLIKDGFRIRELISHAIVDEYETIDYKGFINPQPYFKKHNTNTIAGYVIKFSIEW